MSSSKINQVTSQYSFKKTFIIVFLPFALAFILSCLFRTMNAVLIPTLENLVKIDIAQIGLLNATYFLAYALFQIPLGTFLDNYGAQKTQSILFLIGGCGLIISGVSTKIWVITFGHALIGVGMSGGLMAAFKIISQWFPDEKIPMLNGVMMAFGGIGLLLSTTPTAWLAEHFGWEVLNISFGILAIFIAALIFLLVPDISDKSLRTTLSNQLHGVLDIFKSRDFWKLAPITTSVLASFMSIHGLWIESWLENMSNFNQGTIDNYLIAMALAMTISLLSTGYIAKFSKKYGFSLEKALGVLLVVYICVECGILFSHSRHEWILWILLSLVSQIFTLSYAILTQKFKKSHSGRANTALNVIIFTFTFLIQYAIGFAINFFDEFLSTSQSYTLAFSIPIVVQIIAIISFYVLCGYKSDIKHSTNP